MTKLTTQEIEEIKDNADEVYWFAKKVFKYRKNGKYTLIQDGKVLIEDVDDVWWGAKDRFIYQRCFYGGGAMKKKEYKNKVKND